MNYPGGGVALDPHQGVDVDAIEKACRKYLNADSDPESSLNVVSNDTGDPFEFDVAIEVFAQSKVSYVWNCAPSKSWAEFSRKNETPSAVMRGAMRGALRRRR